MTGIRTAGEYLEEQAESHNMELFSGVESYREVYVTDSTSGADLIQFVTYLEERKYGVSLHRDNSIRILPPHHDEHPRDISPWDCGSETTLLGCKVIRQAEGGRPKA